MSDLDSIRACVGKIQTIRGLTKTLWNDLNKAIFPESLQSRLESLVDRYKETHNWINTYFSAIGNQMPFISIPLLFSIRLSSDAVPYLQDIMIGCQTAEKGLETKLKPKVEPEVIDRLDSIRNNLKGFEEKGLDLNLIRNIQTAIEEAEQGHYLASAMISSRAIAYTSDQIKGKNDEEKVQYLVDNGIIKKDRKDEQKQLMSSMRLSRNFLAHRIDLFSDSGNVLMLIGGAVTLSRILLSLKTV